MICMVLYQVQRSGAISGSRWRKRISFLLMGKQT